MHTHCSAPGPRPCSASITLLAWTLNRSRHHPTDSLCIILVLHAALPTLLENTAHYYVPKTACLREEIATICPGSCNNTLGCTACPAARPLFVPDSDSWHWSCNTCTAVGLGCSNTACGARGCTVCNGPSKFLAPAGFTHAKTFTLAGGASRSYATCVNCADAWGAQCTACRTTGCTRCS